MRRLLNWLKGLFNSTMDKVEDPEVMLEQARRDMQQVLMANRERAVQAMTQKNRLEQMLADEQRNVQSLENQAAMALKQGNRDLATQLMREKLTKDAIITQLQTSYDGAVATVEQVKIALKRQEEEVKKKHAEALAMKAQWKNAQIQTSIAKALDGLTFENQFEGFGAVEERIRTAQSEAAARQELRASSLQGQVDMMTDASRDLEAEAALDALEQRLASGGPAVQPVETRVTVGPGKSEPVPDEMTSEADKALADLEARINATQPETAG